MQVCGRGPGSQEQEAVPRAHPGSSVHTEDTEREMRCLRLGAEQVLCVDLVAMVRCSTCSAAEFPRPLQSSRRPSDGLPRLKGSQPG